MDTKEVLKFADDLVFANTGKHLDNLQEAILSGTLQGKRYSKIAEENNCTQGHAKDVASEFWKILSEILGEDVSKSNFRATLERLRFSNISNFGKDFVQIGKFNLCGDTLHSPEVENTRSQQEESSYQDSPTLKVRQDLGDAPDVSLVYGRTEELTTLERWIVQERCRLVSLSGMSGIGKTALAVQLVEQIKDKFDYVIWRSLRSSPPLEAIERNLLQFFSNQQETESSLSSDDTRSRLIDYLRKFRCLIILDDVQMIFSSGYLAGHYKPEYEDYGSLFRQIGELSHNSCFVLNSWDKPREIAKSEGKSAPVRSVQLDGLGREAIEIFKEKRLVEEKDWISLVNLYRGNPLWLKIIATLIKDLFGGRSSDYFKYAPLVLGDELKTLLTQQFQRLSELEKQVMSYISSKVEPVSTAELLENTQLSPSELFNALQSLGWRSLMEKQEQDNQTVFTLAPVVKQYAKTQYPPTEK